MITAISQRNYPLNNIYFIYTINTSHCNYFTNISHNAIRLLD